MFAGIFPLLWFFTSPVAEVNTKSIAEIPTTTTFCGVELTITEKGKEKIREYKKKLYENPVYFNAAVNRGDTYLPFVEEALSDIGVPDDLKYLPMQESNLKAEAVSSSNAVGFWQFKAEVAEEVGLIVNEFVDERKHIYRSSIAAASYISKVNRNYDNWLYAIIAYYEGTTGSLAYTSVGNYGKKSMVIDENTHWYLVKTIAYKMTYEDALNITFQPNTWLEPISATCPLNSKTLATKHGLTEEKFLEYNKWMLQKSVPEGGSFTYYIPHTGEIYRKHTSDPNKAFNGKEVVTTKIVPKLNPVKPEPKPVTPPVKSEPVVIVPSPKPNANQAVNEIDLPADRYVRIELEDDLFYGEEALLSDIQPEYILYSGKQSLQDIALYFGITYSNLMDWNRTSVQNEPRKGSIIYLKKPKKSRFHIVESGESLADIAKKHRTSVSKIQKKNGMKKDDLKIYTGQRINLKENTGKNDKVIILTSEMWKNAAIQPIGITENIAIVEEKKEERVPVVSLPFAGGGAYMDTLITRDTIYPKPSPVISRWITHTVVANETLWGISQRYKTTVDIIKKVNALPSDALSPGQRLSIFTTLPDLGEYQDGYYHTVLGGETIEKIATRYGVPAYLVAKKNGITAPSLKPGSILFISRE